MKFKIEYLILVAAILALSMYLIMRKSDLTHYQLPTPPEVLGKEISKIEILKPGSSVVLAKKSGNWHIKPQGYAADYDKVKNILDTIEEFTLTALVSESENYKRYNLDDDNKITIRSWTGDTVRREFEVGKPVDSLRHTFVKLPSDHRVYHAQGNFKSTFDQDPNAFRDKAVFIFEPDEIQEIRITQGRQSLTLSRKQVPVEESNAEKAETEEAGSSQMKTIWQTAEGKQGDDSRLEGLLSTLSKLHCKQYLDDREKDELTNPMYSLELTGSKEYKLSIFPKTAEESKDYPSISSENEYPFLLPDWQTDNIMSTPAELLK